MNVDMKLLAAIAWVSASLVAASAHAHCDTLDGPVVAAARQALESGKLSPALAWVQAKDEDEIRSAFQKAQQVRSSGGAARELADSYFFETLVRVHRVGEGAAYTGLKPAGHTEPPVAAADQAIATGRLQPLTRLIGERTQQGLQRHFDQTLAKKKHGPEDVAAGRAYSKAYVEFVHYAERLYNAAEALAPEAAPAPTTATPKHTH